jgi:cell division protein FtsB
VKPLIAILVLLLLALQYRLWVGDGGIRGVWELQEAIDAQRDENGVLSERNRALDAEVRDLKTGLDAVEERARNEVGMIREGETFYRIVEPRPGSRAEGP